MRGRINRHYRLLIGAVFFNLNKLSLGPLQKAVKELDRKMDKMLSEPEASARKHFNDAFLAIQAGDPEEAYTKFRKVDSNTVKGFSLADSLQAKVIKNWYTEEN